MDNSLKGHFSAEWLVCFKNILAGSGHLKYLTVDLNCMIPLMGKLISGW